MIQIQRVRFVAAAWVVALLCHASAYGQGAVQASVTGIVRDASGAVLPGVTVEAASPVLIEKTRSAVTDGAGRYRLIELPPGTYAVTYTLAGFNAVRREGLELSGSLVATIDIDLKIGSLQETITVSGESPIVDVQNIKQQRVIDQAVVDSIPGSRMYHNLVVLVPGLQTSGQNVGGINGPAPLLIGAHGGAQSEGRINVDGLGVNGSSGGGSLYVTDTANVSEVTIDITGGLGESEAGGPAINVVPRSGGNTFSGRAFASGANQSMQGSNFTTALSDLGLRAAGPLSKMWDLNGAFGGPLKKDKLWFFGTARYQGTQRYVAGMYLNLNAGNPAAWTYAPDLAKQAISDGVWDSAAVRLTWQASARNKLNVFWDEQHMCRNCWGGGSATVSPEAQDGSQNVNWMRAYQVSYSAPWTSRVLVEAGIGGTAFSYGNPRDGFDRSLVRVVEQAGAIPGLTYRSMFWDQVRSSTPRYRASLTYVTGSHSLKVGIDSYNSISKRNYQRGDGLQYRFNNGVPNQLTMLLNDFTEEAHVRNTALFAQDRWTVGRVTLQGGLRYEGSSSGTADQTIGPSRFVPAALSFSAQELIPGYRNIMGRGGVAIDLFGDAKTALKVNVGRYVDPALWAGVYIEPNPARALFGGGVPPQTTRSWTDTNKNFTPDCNLLNLASNGECGAAANQSFGRTSSPSATYDPAMLQGWGVRPGNWQMSVAVQRQIIPRMSIEGGYYRRWFDSFAATDNRAVTPGDFNPYSITVPVDPNLPGGGGYVVRDLYDIAPSAFGKTDNFNTLASNYGDQKNYWQGVDLQLNARLKGGLTLQGGTSTGRTITDACSVVIDNPSRRACRAEFPFQTDLRGLAVYMVPRIDVQVSGTLQSRPGLEIPATWNVPNSVIQPSLGRPLAGGAANVAVNILDPGQVYGDRITQVDMRFAKILKFGRMRANVGVDLYNLLNSNVALTYITTYGATWARPNSILDARFAKVSAQLDF